jgi:hypothetical protein
MEDDHDARLARIEAVLPTLPTKADLEALRGDITRMMLGTAVALFVGMSGLVFAAATMLTRPAAAAGPAQIVQCPPCPVQQLAPKEKSPR